MSELVFLIGFRGVGKTSVGTLLAQQLNYDFYDVDTLISERHRMTITDIVARHGWPFFRHREYEVLQSMIGFCRAVVSTGGGAVLHQEIWRRLPGNAVVFYLYAEEEVIAQRIGEDETTSDGRPSLSGGEVAAEISSILKERTPLYEATGHHRIDTSRLTVTETALTIMQKLSQQRNV